MKEAKKEKQEKKGLCDDTKMKGHKNEKKDVLKNKHTPEVKDSKPLVNQIGVNKLINDPLYMKIFSIEK
jgi:hypothetical protein